MPLKTITEGTVSDAYLALLADRGIDYFFGNAGTDFAPIIESFSKAQALGTEVPKAMLVPHENLAIHMALGYYAVTGRPQVVMVHVNVGTANALNGIINASRGNIPVIFSSGRTPYSETGDREGRRTREVHWPQEMFDQGALAREMVKWDYELKDKAVLETVVDRAINVAMTEPRGPIYLTLPREPLAERFDSFDYTSPSRHSTPTAAWPDPNAIDRLASLIANADNPLIITQDSGSDVNAVAPLSALSDRFAIPVIQRKPRYLCLPSDHPMHLGFDPDPYLDYSDLVIVAQCDVPWIPSVKAPGEGSTIVHMGPDPIFSDYPIRGYEADLAITGSITPSFQMLDDALAGLEAGAKNSIETRRKRITGLREIMHENWAAGLEKSKSSSPMSQSWISHCISEVKDDDTILITESAFSMPQMNLTKPGSFISGGAGGGLGYGLGMSLGAKLAAPDRMVICTQGDGAYMYGNPIPAHYVAAAETLPTLTVIMNNEQWGAVKRNTRAMYPDGYAVKSNREDLTFFEGGMAFEKSMEVTGGYGERVEDPAKLPMALERAAKAVGEGQAAVLNLQTV